MSGFQFRLEALLSVRRSEQQQRQVRLAEALAAEQDLARRLAEVERTLAEHQAQARHAAAPGAIDVAQLAQAAQYQSQLRRQAEALRELVREAEAETERRRQELLEANRERKAVELLRERQQAAFVAASRRAEQRQLDETAARTAGSGGGG
ncbi:MAG: flagellar export protein FliJ [Pirellulales bacterium]